MFHEDNVSWSGIDQSHIEAAEQRGNLREDVFDGWLFVRPEVRIAGNPNEALRG